MNLSDEEFLSLSGQMSDRDVKIAALENKVSQLEGELQVARAERDEWQRKYEQTEASNAATQFENAMLKNYLWLSWSKIKHFVAHVSDIRQLAFLQTFMQKTVSDTMGGKALEAINDAVELPEQEPHVKIDADQFIVDNNGTVEHQ
ncbi:MAG: hypothetical protein IJ618_02970 [Prevotella sp.]|nr:hypothetical protein [Prevotella sp.]